MSDAINFAILDNLEQGIEPKIGQFYRTLKPVAGRDLKPDGKKYLDADYPQLAAALKNGSIGTVFTKAVCMPASQFPFSHYNINDSNYYYFNYSILHIRDYSVRILAYAAWAESTNGDPQEKWGLIQSFNGGRTWSKVPSVNENVNISGVFSTASSSFSRSYALPRFRFSDEGIVIFGNDDAGKASSSKGNKVIASNDALNTYQVFHSFSYSYAGGGYGGHRSLAEEYAYYYGGNASDEDFAFLSKNPEYAYVRIRLVSHKGGSAVFFRLTKSTIATHISGVTQVTQSDKFTGSLDGKISQIGDYLFLNTDNQLKRLPISAMETGEVATTVFDRANPPTGTVGAFFASRNFRGPFVCGNTLYGALEKNLYKSTDTGLTWVRVGAIADEYFTKIVGKDDVILLVTHSPKTCTTYSSTNGGASFSSAIYLGDKAFAGFSYFSGYFGEGPYYVGDNFVLFPLAGDSGLPVNAPGYYPVYDNSRPGLGNDHVRYAWFATDGADSSTFVLPEINDEFTYIRAR